MKPQELYSGQAPAAMAQMGQGLSQVGASIAASTLAGYQDLGKGIATGISSIGEAYAKHKEMQQTNKSYEDLIKNPVAQKALGLNPDTAQQFLMASDNLGTIEKHKLFSTFLPMALQQSAFQQKTDAEIKLAQNRINAENWRTIYGLEQQAALETQREKAATERAKLQIQAQEKMPWIQGAAASMQQGNLIGVSPNKSAGFSGGIIQPMIGNQSGLMQIQGFNPSSIFNY